VVKTPALPKPHRRQTCDVDSRVEANEMKHDWLREASDNLFVVVADCYHNYNNNKILVTTRQHKNNNTS